MKVKYEYEVVATAPDGYPVYQETDTRQRAREIKNDLVKLYDCKEAKIVQRKYVLQEQREVR